MPRPVFGLFFSDGYTEISRLSADASWVEKYNRLPLPPQVVERGEIINKAVFTEILRQLVKPLINHWNKKSNEVVIGVSDTNIFLKEFVSQKRVGKEFEEAVDYQVKSLTPTLPGGVASDWQIVGQAKSDSIELLLASISQSTINDYISCVKAVGMRVVGIEPLFLANLRLIEREMIVDKNILLVYVANNFAEFTYATNGNVRFSDSLEISEIQKRGTFASVINDYLVYINSHHPGRTVQDILMSGTNEQLGRLFQELKDGGLKVEIARTMVLGIPGNLSRCQPSYGLGYKTAESGQVINLLPSCYRLAEMEEKVSLRMKWILGMLTFLTILCGGRLFYTYMFYDSKQKASAEVIKIYRKEYETPDNQEAIKQVREINDLAGKILKLRTESGKEVAALKQLSQSVPMGIKLTSMTYVRDYSAKGGAVGNWTLTGVANSRELVLNFYQDLVQKSEFSSGKLFFGSLEKEAGVTFRIASFSP